MTKRQLSVGVLLLIVAIFVSGCTGVPVVMVPQSVASLEEVVDLSAYIVTEPEIEPNLVPIEEELSYVDTEYLMKLMKLDGPGSASRSSYEEYSPEWSFVLVDARPEAKYQEGHINGAINIPDAQFDAYAHLLPADKDMMLIFYCGGLECHLSANSAKKAIALGYTNVHVYQEGTPFWKAAGNYFVVTPEYVSSLITSDSIGDTYRKPLMIVDSRPYDVYFNGHLPDALSMPDALFAGKYLSSMPADKNTEIITYCGGFHCLLSHNSAQILVDNGYTDVKVMAGGVPAWKQAGLPLFGLEAGGGEFDLTGGKPKRDITSEQFKTMINGANVVVIDVRNDTERSSGHIPGSIHIPDVKIHDNPAGVAGQLPADKNTTLLIHCASGARAGGVVHKIADLGYPNTFYLNSRIVIDSSGNFSF
jgi:rhodanese-related sulfurtransferase